MLTHNNRLSWKDIFAHKGVNCSHLRKKIEETPDDKSINASYKALYQCVSLHLNDSSSPEESISHLSLFLNEVRVEDDSLFNVFSLFREPFDEESLLMKRACIGSLQLRL